MTYFRSPFNSTVGAIGDTPVVKLKKVLPAACADVYVKLEYYSPTGSYKDRMALAMIEEAEKREVLQPGMTVLEYTGGSTGSSLAFVCAVKGYPFKVVSSDAFSQEKLRTMEAFGAELFLVPSDGGKITSDLVPRMIEKARELAEEDGVYWTDQLNNHDSVIGYRQIGHELLDQLPNIDLFCGAVGTAGMLMGVSGVLKEHNSKIRTVAFEPASSAVISTGESGTHHVEGIGIGFIPPLFDHALVDDVRGIEEREGRELARRLAREEGLFVGTSSGLNIAGAIRLAQELGSGHAVATVACDTGLKYLAGDLFG